MSTPASSDAFPPADLAVALEAATRHAETLRADLAPEAKEASGNDDPEGCDDSVDVSEVVASGVLLERFLSDVEEAVRQLFTAGLSFPDPELPEELTVLAERAERHGLPTAVAHLQRLRLWITSIGEHNEAEGRLRLAEGAWDETQRLLAWLRLFRTELDFLTIEGALAVEASGDTERTVSRVPTRTSTVWPVGLELEPSGKLLIFGFDVDAKMPVLLRDQLAELNPDDPIGDRAISRLFQDQVNVGQIMKGLVRLEDHPVVRRQSSMLFRPAFRAIPKVLAVAGDFQAPELPALDPERNRGQHVPGPVTATIELRGGKLRWSAPFDIDTNDVLQLNLMKLLARDRQAAIEIDLVARLKDDSLRLLSATTVDDGTVFIADDPTLFRLAPNVLASSAIEASGALARAPFIGAWLRSTSFLFGGADGSAVAKVREDLSSAQLSGLDQHYTAGLTSFLLGDGIPPASVEKLVRETLGLASRRSGDPVQLSSVSRVIGRKASSADLKLIDDDDLLVYQALWLILQSDLVGAMESELRALSKRRYSTKIGTITPATVCARALSTFLMEILDGTFDPEDDESGKASKAREFLDAHLADLSVGTGRRRRRRRTQMPTPELLELFQLADTRAVVTGSDRHHGTIDALGMPRLAIAGMCAKALMKWRLGEADVELAREAAKGLLIIAAAGLSSFFVL